MKIALIGYGKMSKMIEQITIRKGHQTVSIIGINNAEDTYSEAFESVGAAIEFTTPAAASNNYMEYFEVGVSVVSDTTRRLDRIGEIKERREKEGRTLSYVSNFSIGVNVFFAMDKYLVKVMNNFPSYDVKMMEVHHIHKPDALSGTTITLAEGTLGNIDHKDRWTLENAESATDLPIHVIREGEAPGIHEITYESGVGTVSVKHDVKSRTEFALGVVIATEFTAEKKGFLGMNDLSKF